MNNCIGFPSGRIANTYTTQTGISSTFASTVAKPDLIAIYINTNDR
jgi:hypothetical protein